MSGEGLPSASDVWRARSRIRGLVGETPTLPSVPLSTRLGGDIHLKWETMHPTGAFKVRGAANKLMSLSPEMRRRGVATFSTGNHGQAVAYVARRLGAPATVCVSSGVPRNKIAALEGLGARVEVHGSSQDDAEEYCYNLGREEGLEVIKPFDDPDVIAGQGTIGLELLDQLPGLETLLVPLSGGGLIAGIALALKANLPSVRIVGITMERGAVMYASLREGSPVRLAEEETLADSLRGGIGRDNRYTFPLVRELVDETLLVSEEAIARAMAYILTEHRMAVEGAAAVGVAALLEGKVEASHRLTAAVITGNNLDMTSFMEAVSSYL